MDRNVAFSILRVKPTQQPNLVFGQLGPAFGRFLLEAKGPLLLGPKLGQLSDAAKLFRADYGSSQGKLLCQLQAALARLLEAAFADGSLDLLVDSIRVRTVAAEQAEVLGIDAEIEDVIPKITAFGAKEIRDRVIRKLCTDFASDKDKMSTVLPQGVRHRGSLNIFSLTIDSAECKSLCYSPPPGWIRKISAAQNIISTHG
jgi:hypothetical protein